MSVSSTDEKLSSMQHVNDKLVYSSAIGKYREQLQSQSLLSRKQQVIRLYK